MQERQTFLDIVAAHFHVVVIILAVILGGVAVLNGKTRTAVQAA